jgi:Ca2+-binding EF-hand superfamily protein
MKSLALTVILVCLLTAAATAASHQKLTAYNIPDAEGYNAHFGDMDPDRDGKVTWQEFKTYFPKTDERAFAVIDLNKDGAVDHDEWHMFKAAHDLKHKD